MCNTKNAARLAGSVFVARRQRRACCAKSRKDAPHPSKTRTSSTPGKAVFALLRRTGTPRLSCATDLLSALLDGKTGRYQFGIHGVSAGTTVETKNDLLPLSAKSGRDLPHTRKNGRRQRASFPFSQEKNSLRRQEGLSDTNARSKINCSCKRTTPWRASALLLGLVRTPTGICSF